MVSTTAARMVEHQANVHWKSTLWSVNFELHMIPDKMEEFFPDAFYVWKA